MNLAVNLIADFIGPSLHAETVGLLAFSVNLAVSLIVGFIGPSLFAKAVGLLSLVFIWGF